MPSRVRERFDEIERKIKILKLETERRLANVELSLTKMEEEVKKISSEFPSIKDRTEEIEDLINIINLGLVQFKEKFKEFNEKTQNIEKNLKPLKDELETISESIKKIEEKIEETNTRIETLEPLKEWKDKEEEEREKLRKELDTISTSLKSIQRTIELMNLEDVSKRFSIFEGKLAGVEAEVSRIKELIKDTSTLESDVNLLKMRIKELRSSVLDSLNKVDELEMKINKKLAALETFTVRGEHLAMIDETSKLVKEESEKIRKMKEEIEGIFTQVSTLRDHIMRELSSLEKYKADIEEVKNIVNENRIKIEELEKSGTQTQAEKIISDYLVKLEELNRKVNDLEKKLEVPREVGNEEVKTQIQTLRDSVRVIQEKLKNYENSLASLQKTLDEIRSSYSNFNQFISQFDEKIKGLERQNALLLQRVMEKIKEIESFKEKLQPEKLEAIYSLKDQVESIRKSMLTFNKLWNENIAKLQEKLAEIPGKVSVSTKEIPHNLMEELSSLRELMKKLSEDNEYLKKITRELRTAEMASVKMETFTTLATKVDALEKKLVELEKEISKLSKSKPVVIE